MWGLEFVRECMYVCMYVKVVMDPMDECTSRDIPATSTTLTISHIRVFNLLQHRGPHGCVALLVLLYFLRAQVEPLADAAGALVRFRSGLVVFGLPEAFGGHAGWVGAGVCVRRWLE